MGVSRKKLEKFMKPFIVLEGGFFRIKRGKAEEVTEALLSEYGCEIGIKRETNSFNREFLTIYSVGKTRMTKIAEYYIGEIKDKPLTYGRKETMSPEDVFVPIVGENYIIQEQIGILSETEKGWKKELNLVSWFGKEEKYDIRDWSPDHKKMEKE